MGEEFTGLIISTTRFGFFVELENLFVEGLVPIDTLPGDRYMFHENVRKIIGQRTAAPIQHRRHSQGAAGPRGSRGAQAAVFTG